MKIQELKAALAAKGISVPKNAKKAELELALAQQVDCDTTVEATSLTAEWIALEEAVVLGTSFSLSCIRQLADAANVTNTLMLLKALEGYSSRSAIARIIGSASFPRFQGSDETYVRTSPRGGSQISSSVVDAACAASDKEVTLDKLMAAILELRSEVQKLTEKK